ncbi:U11/U12 small nuclear ribonucleoprotein 48 kDa protein [Schistosoma japonicum]|nr:U11/U12 small nuclear ribonucleoprotein 48 kDa protein [Schistosoma japonicum]
MLIHESQKTLDDLISSFGWTHEFLLSSSEYERCSYVQNHWVPVKSIKAHNNYCSLRQQGFVKEEIVLREIIAQQTEMLTAAHESMDQSEDRRSMYVRVALNLFQKTLKEVLIK